MNSKKEVQHVYLVGAKSLGAYGGYETFVYKLTEYHQNKENIKYHVACKANGDGCMDESKFDGVTKINDHEFEFHNAHCFKIDVPQIGPAQAIYYDVAALKACCEHIKKNHIPHPIVYIMACRIGPFASHFYREIHKLGGTVYLNPDGHEWMRAKWSAPIRKYWKISEQMMVKYCDLAICDSVNIEKYIHECYDGKGIQGSSPKTTFIAYGADLTLSKLADDDEKLMNWYREKGLTKKDYYLVVGRFVPENSFEVMIREFMKSKSKKNFAIITNVNEKFLNELEEKLHFKSDKRIKFVGTVYDQELLKKIRENAYAYFHGHTVGGTNPSLIEALGSTDLNLLVDVGFNKEVAEDCALYWSRKPGSLAKLIDKADRMSADEIAEIGRRAKKRVAEEYTWDKICGQYENTFDIAMAVFDIGQSVVNSSSGIIRGNTAIDISSLSMQMQAAMATMAIGELVTLALETLVVSWCLKILSVVITVIMYGRMIEIYLYTSLAPIPFATMSNREWGHVGTNYFRGLFALAFQAFLMMVCVAIYAALIGSIRVSSDIHSALFGTMAYTVILCFSLLKTGSLSKQIFGSH